MMFGYIKGDSMRILLQTLEREIWYGLSSAQRNVLASSEIKSLLRVPSDDWTKISCGLAIHR